MVGVLIGLLVGLHVRDLAGGLAGIGQRIEVARTMARPDFLARAGGAPGLRPMPLWHQAACTALAVAPEGPQRIVLTRLVEDGEAALELLVASTGVSKRVALARVLGESVVAAHAVQWRL